MSALLSFPIDSRAKGAQAGADMSGAEFTVPADTICIRGTTLNLDELVDRSLFQPEVVERLRAELQAGSPFPHLVLNNIFNPKLLDLVIEEFDELPGQGWSDIKTRYESTRRSVLGATLGPASQLYFNVINSGWFTEWLSSVTGVPYLLTDPKLFGGGLHESRQGATFAVHRDFNLHRHLGLKNEMVFITYLNKGWQPEWGSALELWDKKADRCITEVQPEYGRTILLPHGPASYHGHTKPLQTPDGRPRRSIAAYFYTSPMAGEQHGDESASVFMKTLNSDKVKTFARGMTPPLFWSLARKITGKK